MSRSAAPQVQQVPLAAISVSGRNPRQRVAGVDDLAASLQEHGLLHPVLLRPAGRKFELVAGHRRVEAARQLGWANIAAIVRAGSDEDSYVLGLVENLQREDLTPREEAEGLAVLVRERGWSTRRVATAIHRSQAFVSKRLRVFEDALLAPAVLADQLSISAAEELLGVNERQRYDLLARAIEGQWDRAQVRTAIRGKSVRRSSVIRHARQLRMELRDVRAEALTESDRRELRLLFSELSMLARARPGAARTFPPLPQARHVRQRK